MDFNRNQYSPVNYGSGQPVYASAPGSPPPNVYPKPAAETNYNPGFTVAPQPVSQVTRPLHEMPNAQTPPPSAFRPRTLAQWISAAKESTLEFKRNGSPSPLVWVLVEGKNIPENAIVGGEDRRKPLYIARSFFEGGIYIGKAGRHLKLGAAIPYNGREIEVSSYEVLVPALQPIRYTISDSLSIREIPRIISDEENQELRRLNEIKTVILVDDSASMYGDRWAEAREALAGVADLAAKYSAEGVDVYFLNNPRFGADYKDGTAIRALFDSVVPEGQTPTGAKLTEIFSKYLPLLEDQRLNHKPITIVVITDGEPTDEPKEVIIDAARRLDRTGVATHRFGIQFAQIGDDEDASIALRELDDGIAAVNGIRDMVDYTPCNPNDLKFTTDTVIKILLGATNRLVDGLNAQGQPLI